VFCVFLYLTFPFFIFWLVFELFFKF